MTDVTKEDWRGVTVSKDGEKAKYKKIQVIKTLKIFLVVEVLCVFQFCSEFIAFSLSFPFSFFTFKDVAGHEVR